MLCTLVGDQTKQDNCKGFAGALVTRETLMTVKQCIIYNVECII